MSLKLELNAYTGRTGLWCVQTFWNDIGTSTLINPHNIEFAEGNNTEPE